MDLFTAFLVLLLFLILGGAIYWKELAPHPTREPPPFPEHIVRAWQDAGAEVGWIGRNSRLVFTYFNTFKDPDMVDAVPAFSIGEWRAGLLAQLPDPGIPFGLDLSRIRITDAGLKELAALKNLTTLDLGGTQITDA
ncbi:MAG: leucine-rich repeat domain-containing protein, partial [Gemmatales bacterium]|nr:leucine-rich repeat domain-containing protein [Gemmatales bacterium]